MSNKKEELNLKKELSPLHLWGIIVGMVISGMYFGWNYGLGQAGPIGLVIATVIVTLFYTTFIFSYAEMSTAIPHAGGPYAYARRALGPFGGFLAGFSTIIEFVFAPPAIALAVGAYINFLVPAIPVTAATIGAFLIFLVINSLGVKEAAIVELVATVLAIVGLVIFIGAGLPKVDMSNFVTTPALPFGWQGVFAAIPFAIWFYLAVEGGAMAAEEVANPTRDIPRAFISGILTLVGLALVTLFVTSGMVNWETISSVDSPLPTALRAVFGENSFIAKIVASIGLFGLIASLHGIILGYSRQVFAMARDGYLPRFLAYLHPQRKTPLLALWLPGIIGMGIALTGLTNVVIVISVFGAVMMYIIAMISLFVLRVKEPKMTRPYKVNYPLIPGIALLLAVICLAAVVYSNLTSLIPVLITYAVAIVYYLLFVRNSSEVDDQEFKLGTEAVPEASE